MTTPFLSFTEQILNVALNKPTFQSSTANGSSSSFAVDPDPSTCTVTNGEGLDWLMIDLMREVIVAYFIVTTNGE